MVNVDPAKTAVLILDLQNEVIHVHHQRPVGASSGAAVEYAVAHLGEVATVDELVAALDKG